VHGRLGAGEGSFEHLAEREGCRTVRIDALGPELSPRDDLRATLALRRIIREFQPDIVHSHTAKAGFVARAAALSARSGGGRPAIVHTFHGHVLEGYFGRGRNALYRSLERGLARSSDRLVGVSQATVDDLVRLRVAARERFRVVPIGLDLGRFERPDAAAAAAFRAASGAEPGDVLVGLVGRLVPIKRVDVALRAHALLRTQGLPVRLAIVGDGTLRGELEALATAMGVSDSVSFHGYVGDVAPVAAAIDVALLSSDNEGTPVALIEAGAAGRPAVATAVGGVSDVVAPGAGALAPPDDPAALARALEPFVLDPALRESAGALARSHSLSHYSAERLLADTDALYSEVLAERGVRTHTGAPRGTSFSPSAPFPS
jgi:glycosyltransferase involved in cell wall biosynthesis